MCVNLDQQTNINSSSSIVFKKKLISYSPVSCLKTKIINIFDETHRLSSSIAHSIVNGWAFDRICCFKTFKPRNHSPMITASWNHLQFIISLRTHLLIIHSLNHLSFSGPSYMHFWIAILLFFLLLKLSNIYDSFASIYFENIRKS